MSALQQSTSNAHKVLNITRLATFMAHMVNKVEVEDTSCCEDVMVNGLLWGVIQGQKESARCCGSGNERQCQVTCCLYSSMACIIVGMLPREF